MQIGQLLGCHQNWLLSPVGVLLAKNSTLQPEAINTQATATDATVPRYNPGGHATSHQEDTISRPIIEAHSSRSKSSNSVFWIKFVTLQ